VLIQPKSKAILPDWLRFVKGVVDSEDLPLNISRENMQDSALISRMNNVLTKKIIKFLADMSRTETAKYNQFYGEFANFIKEGVCSDFTHKADIAQLLRFDTSLGEKQLSSLDDYISRMPIEQKDIYYLCAPSRSFALSSPYFEHFDKEGIEVLFLYAHIDDFVMKNLDKYNKRQLISIESANVKKAEDAKETKTDDPEQKANAEQLVAYFQETLKDKVISVKATDRLSNSPAIVVDHESGAVRKMLKYVDAASANDLGKQKLEINPKHPTMVNLLKVRETKPELAKMIAEQIFDNALIAADILDNPRTMLARLNKILEATAH
jgi:HSP90 family molecular chaperone